MNKLDFHKRIKSRLLGSEYATEKTRDNGKTISNLSCPKCGDKTAWAYSEEPLSINCNRMNKCGARTKVLDLFPEMLKKVEEEFPYTAEDPNRPATAYSNRRGLNNSLKGLEYRYMANLRGTGSGGVMFPIGKDAKGNTIFNGRLFNPPPTEGKTHNIGSTAGRVWQHPGIEYDYSKETFVTEGVINALSLIELGHQAISVLSAGQDPSRVDLSKFQKLVFAFDPDEAGKRALKKWRKAHPTAGAVLLARGDWNDFLTSLPIEKAKALFLKKRAEFEVLACLARATHAYAYADIFRDFYQRAPGLFDFNGCYYFSSFKRTSEGEILLTDRVSNFTLNVRYYQLDTTNPEEPINRFFLDISPRKGFSTTCSVTAQELASANSLTTMILQRSRSLWEGDRAASIALARMIVESGAPVVRQLQTVGHDRESNCFVFKHFLIDPKGVVVLPNSFGFFEISRTISIQPAPYPTLKPVKGISAKEVWELVFCAWGPKGIVALIWVVAGWWVNQIKAKIGFFPF
jgi:hypothetical protein